MPGELRKTDFSWALERMKAGRVLARKIWPQGSSVVIITVKGESRVRKTEIKDGRFSVLVKWSAPSDDMVAEDWTLLD